jgi:hypothetical protein
MAVLEVLHSALMLFSLFAGGKRSQIAALAGPRVRLPRVQSILARLEFADHDSLLNDKTLIENAANNVPLFVTMSVKPPELILEKLFPRRGMPFATRWNEHAIQQQQERCVKAPNTCLDWKEVFYGSLPVPIVYRGVYPLCPGVYALRGCLPGRG